MEVRCVMICKYMSKVVVISKICLMCFVVMMLSHCEKKDSRVGSVKQNSGETSSSAKDNKATEAEVPKEKKVEQKVPETNTVKEPEKGIKEEKVEQKEPGKIMDDASVEDAVKSVGAALGKNVKNYYNPSNRRDPFLSAPEQYYFKAELEKQAYEATKSEQDANERERAKTKKRKAFSPLEQVQIEQIRLAGIAIDSNSRYASVVVVGGIHAGKFFVITEGTFFGEHGGKISKILPDRIIVKEDVVEKDKTTPKEMAICLHSYNALGKGEKEEGCETVRR
ncbi:Pilus assembly protein PilP [Candidatus Magnetobacterium bavaricum]|uniref:Pilus assembly protein PilP n=1 Tax=Candidatus Magnetobacterium bavaricum TaxID=29290 RepID=A0A0F3GWN0_9BACT|nr:Pilus assembly protein PilP [Candidatus Magnetobacterium bavaricum]